MGVIMVSAEHDRFSQIIAPKELFALSIDEGKFSDIIKQYIHDFVKPEYHRNLRNFIQSDVIQNQLDENIIPMISYCERDGKAIKLSIWPVDKSAGETIWVFEKEDNK